jgi:hypothetical protein
MTRPSSSSPKARAEALFKKEVQVRQGHEATTEYRAGQQATRDKTERLRAQRLAHDRDRTDTADATKDGRLADQPVSRRARRGLRQGSRGRS